MKHYYYMGKPIRAARYEMLSKSNPPFKNTLFIKEDKDVQRGTCRICGCTMTDPCISLQYGACSWADDEETICSWCAKWVLNKSERAAVIHRYNSNTKLMDPHEEALKENLESF